MLVTFRWLGILSSTISAPLNSSSFVLINDSSSQPLVYLHFIQNLNLLLICLVLNIISLLMIFILKKVSSTFNKCAPIYYKLTHEFSLLGLYLFMVPICVFTVIEFQNSEFTSTLHMLSFISAFIFILLLVLAILLGFLLILRNKSNLTKTLFQYQNGFLYSMFTLTFPHFIFYFIPLSLFFIAALVQGIDYSSHAYLIGTWTLLAISLLNCISKAILRGFKTTFMNITDIISSFLYLIMWIPLLIKVHKNETNAPCSGGQYILDLFFPILALLWLLTSLILLILYIIRKKNQKSKEYNIEKQSTLFVI